MFSQNKFSNDRKYDPMTGKPLDKSYLEKGLPLYLQHDVDAYIQGKKDKVSHLDCLWGELYGSINSAVQDEITEEQARYLREKYLFDNEKGDES